MSSIISNSLIRNHPELSHALGAIQNWERQHPTADYISAKSLVRVTDRIDPYELALAFGELVREGLLIQRYRLETSDGQVLHHSFIDPNSIPEKIRDDFDSLIWTDDCKVVTVYEPVNDDG